MNCYDSADTESRNGRGAKRNDEISNLCLTTSVIANEVKQSIISHKENFAIKTLKQFKTIDCHKYYTFSQ